jgi:hypothetical protein
MNRFMGMMPSSDVKKEKTFKVGDDQLRVTLQAGEKGWTILFADSSSQYKDVEDTTENNFNSAFKQLKSYFDDINPINKEINSEI